MSRWRILFADNNPFFLKARSEFLEKADFEVVLAGSVEEAEKIMRDEIIHLAVLDIRLKDDDDDRDISGLLLAKKEAYRSIPKIMLTGYPTYQHVRQALGTSLNSIPPAVDFLAKDEGPEAMISAVQRAISENVRVNQNLVIASKDRNPITFLQLVNLIEPELEQDRKSLLARADELETLFRHLFYKEEQIIIDRLLWQRSGRVALLVFKVAKKEPLKSLVVVCGRKTNVAEEERRYRMFAPAPGLTSSVLIESGEMLNFAAITYALAGADLENTRSLFEAYQTAPDKLFYSCLNTLFEKTLAEWHQDKSVIEENRSLKEVYASLLGLSEELFTRDNFEQHLRSLIKQIPRLGLKIESASETLTLRLGGQSYCYPDPAAAMDHMLIAQEPLLLMNTPGALSGDNILVDSNSRAWVTSFAKAGPAPILWNHVSLEAAIRFDWVDSKNLQWIYEMERHLVGKDFGKLYPDDVESPLRKPMKAIQSVRNLASGTAAKDFAQYHVGIFYHAAGRIIEAKPATRPNPLDHDLARLAHALIAAAMICGQIMRSSQEISRDKDLQKAGIRIDKQNRAVWIDGRQVELTGIGYDLLCNLYDHPNQLRTRRELIEEVFSLKYDETDRSQMNRLNTAINRLRKIIRDDADNPRFLFTHPGGGYRLTPNPKI